MDIRSELLNQLNDLIKQGERLVNSYKSDEGCYYSELPEIDFRAFVTTSLSTIERIVGRESEYYLSIPQNDNNKRITETGFDSSFVPGLVGALKALHNAVDKNLLVTLEARLRANIHDDFLIQADELLNQNYYVASIVLIGGVLENHMLKLVTNRGLTWNGSGSLSKYNDLLRNAVYSQSVWRRIQSIADIRNDAAHGNGQNVQRADVSEALLFVQRMLVDYPQ